MNHADKPTCDVYLDFLPLLRKTGATNSPPRRFHTPAMLGYDVSSAVSRCDVTYDVVVSNDVEVRLLDSKVEVEVS